MTPLVVENQFVNRILHEYNNKKLLINHNKYLLTSKQKAFDLCFGIFKLEFNVNLYNQVFTELQNEFPIEIFYLQNDWFNNKK